MRTTTVGVERDIAAPADRVYRIIADYRNHHPHILPPAFTELVVEDGGVGEGTIICFSLRAAGRTQETRQRVEEPEPGSVLVERDMNRDMATTFTVTPATSGAHVRIETRWTGKGVGGFLERLVAPRVLRPIYNDELELLERYAQEQVAI
jgi:hypothetical protein